MPLLKDTSRRLFGTPKSEKWKSLGSVSQAFYFLPVPDCFQKYTKMQFLVKMQSVFNPQFKSTFYFIFWGDRCEGHETDKC